MLRRTIADRRAFVPCRCLRWAETVEVSARRMRARMGIGQRSVEAQLAEMRLRAQFDALRPNRGNVSPLLQVGADGDVGDRILQLVLERGERDLHARRRLPIKPCFVAEQPFGLEVLVRLRGHREHDIGPVKLVQGRQPEAGIGGRPQLNRLRRMKHPAAAP